MRERHVSWGDYRRRHPDGEPAVTLDDVLDYQEMMLVDADNERRAHRRAERKGRAGRGGKR